MRNYYEILEIGIDASDIEIKKAYRKLAKEYHPDKHTNNDNFSSKEFIEINEAYEILNNKETRAKFDSFYQDFIKPKEPEPKQPKPKQPKPKFRYEPFKSFYANRDRHIQETPESIPKYNLHGTIISNPEFIILPSFNSIFRRNLRTAFADS